ncbi:hypothetical protein GJV06_16395 [Enterobacteriaceae bacterium RIT691]|nr:hypothetical protein [Enterobacteriaceae bacterium RIT691]
MKINNRLFLLLIPLITGVICASYAGLSYWQQTHFVCDSQLTMVDSKGTEDVIMHFRFDGDSGHVETRGKYNSGTGEVISTSNKITFNFWREGGSLVMVSNETNRLPKQAPPVLNNVPDFFSSRERGIRLKVVKENAAGYLFLYEDTPALYCRSTQQ